MKNLTSLFLIIIVVIIWALVVSNYLKEKKENYTDQQDGLITKQTESNNEKLESTEKPLPLSSELAEQKVGEQEGRQALSTITAEQPSNPEQEIDTSSEEISTSLTKTNAKQNEEETKPVKENLKEIIIILKYPEPKEKLTLHVPLNSTKNQIGQFYYEAELTENQFVLQWRIPYWLNNNESDASNHTIILKDLYTTPKPFVINLMPVRKIKLEFKTDDNTKIPNDIEVNLTCNAHIINTQIKTFDNMCEFYVNQNATEISIKEIRIDQYFGENIHFTFTNELEKTIPLTIKRLKEVTFYLIDQNGDFLPNYLCVIGSNTIPKKTLGLIKNAYLQNKEILFEEEAYHVYTTDKAGKITMKGLKNKGFFMFVLGDKVGGQFINKSYQALEENPKIEVPTSSARMSLNFLHNGKLIEQTGFAELFIRASDGSFTLHDVYPYYKGNLTIWGLPERQYYLKITPEGYVKKSIRLLFPKQGTLEQDVTFNEPGTLKGYVTKNDETYKEKSIKIRVYSEDTFPYLYEVNTDENGYFEIQNIDVEMKYRFANDDNYELANINLRAKPNDGEVKVAIKPKENLIVTVYNHQKEKIFKDIIIKYKYVTASNHTKFYNFVVANEEGQFEISTSIYPKLQIIIKSPNFAYKEIEYNLKDIKKQYHQEVEIEEGLPITLKFEEDDKVTPINDVIIMMSESNSANLQLQREYESIGKTNKDGMLTIHHALAGQIFYATKGERYQSIKIDEESFTNPISIHQFGPYYTITGVFKYENDVPIANQSFYAIQQAEPYKEIKSMSNEQGLCVFTNLSPGQWVIKHQQSNQWHSYHVTVKDKDFTFEQTINITD